MIQNKLMRIFVLSDLLVQELDPLVGQVPKPETIKIQETFKKCLSELEPIIERFYNSEVERSLIHIELQNKIEYIFKKSLKHSK
jgi:hypothetical protein